MKSFGSEEGSSLVEFAIASALLFMLLFGIIEVAFAFYTYNFTAEAAKETARYLSVRGSNSCTASNGNLANCNYVSQDISSLVRGLGFPGIDSDRILPCSGSTGACASWPDGDNAPGSRVRVVINYPFLLSLPFWRTTVLQLNSTAEMVISD